MKNIKKTLFALFSISLFATIGCFTACKGLGNSDSTTSSTNSSSEAKTLLAPEIMASNAGISWTAIEEAVGYSVKLNDGEWTDVSERTYQFPVAVGTYSLNVAAVGATGEKGETGTFEFSVAQYEVSAVVTENTNIVVFEGVNAMYKVNDDQQYYPVENGMIDFSAVAVGTPIKVSYYAAGNNTWDEENSVYYVDSEVKTVELTVFQKLSAPTISLNPTKDGLTWSEVEGAKAYNVTVDGVLNQVEVTASCEVKFPQSAGAHTIKVQAVGDGTNLLNSDEVVYEMSTQEKSVPKIQFAENISWETDMIPYVQTRMDGGAWQPVSTESVSYQECLEIKTLAYYDEEKKVYIPESLICGFATRENPTLSFNVSGLITWNEEETNSALTYKVVKDSEEVLLQVNEIDVRDMDEGAHTLTVKGLAYLEVTAENATYFFESSATEIEFSVQPAPTIGYQTGKLTWASAQGVEAYEVKKDDGVWTETTALEYTEIDGDGTYSVRALGINNPADSLYIVTSKENTLTLSNTQYANGQFIDYDNLDFSTNPDLAFLAIKNASDNERVVYDATENALLVKDTYHAQQLDINFPSVRLVAGDMITLTMKVVKTQDNNADTIDDGGLELNGGQIFWNDVMTEEYRADRFGGGENSYYNQYKTFTYLVKDEFILTNIKWRPYGTDLITVYLRDITLNRAWSVDETDYESIDFSLWDIGTSHPSQLNRDGVVEELDGYGKALKTSIGHNASTYNDSGLKFAYTGTPITLNAGDKLTASFYGVTSSVCFYLHFNGSATYSKELFVSEQGANTITYRHSGAPVEVTMVGFATWSWDGAAGTMDTDNNGNQRAVFYLQSLIVERDTTVPSFIDWNTTETNTATTYSVNFADWEQNWACKDIVYNGLNASIVEMDVNGTTQNVVCTGMNTNVMKTYFDFTSLNLAGKTVTFKMLMRLNEETSNTSCDIYAGSTWMTGNYDASWMTGAWKTISVTMTVPNSDVWSFYRQGGVDWQWEQKMYIASIEIIVQDDTASAREITWTTAETNTATTYSVNFADWNQNWTCSNVTYNDAEATIVSMDVNGMTQNVLSTGMNTNVMKTYFDFSDLALAGKTVTFKMLMRLNEETNNSKACDIYAGSTWLAGNYDASWMTGAWKTISATMTIPNNDIWSFYRQGADTYAWDQKMYIASIEIIVQDDTAGAREITWTTAETNTATTYSVNFADWNQNWTCSDVTYNDAEATIISMDVNGTTQNVLSTGINTNVMKTYFNFSDLDLAGKTVTFKMTMRLHEETNNSKACDIYAGSTWLAGNYDASWMTASWKTIEATVTVPNNDVWTLYRQGGADWQWDQKMYIASIEIIVAK